MLTSQIDVSLNQYLVQDHLGIQKYRRDVFEQKARWRILLPKWDPSIEAFFNYSNSVPDVGRELVRSTGFCGACRPHFRSTGRPDGAHTPISKCCFELLFSNYNF